MRRLARLLLLIAPILAGCAIVAPLPAPTTLTHRLAVFPTSAPVAGEVIIRWNEHQVPFIQADTDEDLAFTLGMVHAHLRGGQIELFRRASQGRLSEGMGPALAPIDHGLRLVNFGRATPGIIAAMPEETRRFLERFAEGLTWYQMRQPAKPPEMRILAWDYEPWTIEDLVTMGRLGSVDISWLYALRSFSLQRDPNWEDVWDRIQRISEDSIPSHGAPGEGVAGGRPTLNADRVYTTGPTRDQQRAEAFLKLLIDSSRSGSNAIAVAFGEESGRAPLLAADPHVGLQIPPLWMLVGMKSPGYHAVGFMLPGFPVVAIGRNAHGAWGGTNMLSQSTDFVELPEGWQPTATRQERIGVRGWFDRTITIRESEWGPVISDMDFLRREPGEPELALQWMGHRPSDEYTAFLRVIRARNWEEFHGSFETWAVSGQNMMWAGNDGVIGQMMAVRLPNRPNERRSRLSTPADQATVWWSETLGPLELPSYTTSDPAVLISTNNRPAADLPVLVSRFHSSNGRQQRLLDLLPNPQEVRIADLVNAQNDVVSLDFIRLAELLAPHLPDGHPWRDDFPAWNGEFTSTSRTALVLHLLAYHLANAHFTARYGEAVTGSFLSGANAVAFLVEDLENPDFLPGMAALVPGAVSSTEKDLRSMAEGATWGTHHRLRVAHPFSNIPLIGSKFVFGDHPAEGNLLTVRKAGGSLSNKPGNATYGQNGRALFDLGDRDANDFVLFGGQDGWLNSSTSFDQVALFLEGRTIRVPLDPPVGKPSWDYVVTLSPIFEKSGQ